MENNTTLELASLVISCGQFSTENLCIRFETRAELTTNPWRLVENGSQNRTGMCTERHGLSHQHNNPLWSRSPRPGPGAISVLFRRRPNGVVYPLSVPAELKSSKNPRTHLSKAACLTKLAELREFGGSDGKQIA